MLVAQNSLGPVCPVPLTVRGNAESRTGSEEYQRLKTPRAAKKPARSVSDGEK